MRTKFKKELFILCFMLGVLCNHLLFASGSKIDSLSTLISHDHNDTVMIDHLNLLSREYIISGKFLEGVANAGKTVDFILMNPVFDPPGSEKMILTTDKKYDRFIIQLLKGLAKAYGYIGTGCLKQGDYPRSLDNYFKALEITEAYGDRSSELKYLTNIGIIYASLGENEKALDYYIKALAISRQLSEKKIESNVLSNIGTTYLLQRKFDKALLYYDLAMKIAEELGDEETKVMYLINIGDIYAGEQKYDTALVYYFRSLDLAKRIGTDISIHHAFIGDVLRLQGKYRQAEVHLLEGLRLLRELGRKDPERQVLENLSELYFSTGKYKLALEMFKKNIELKDSIFNADKSKEITRREMTYEFDKKEAAAKAEADKQAAVAEAEKRKQQVILYSVTGGLTIVLLFAGFIFRSLRIARKQKQLIEQQKHLVEEKQKEILDSIHYARRIQTALLPTDKYLDKTIKRLMKL